jgi:hypothetical protein
MTYLCLGMMLIAEAFAIEMIEKIVLSDCTKKTTGVIKSGCGLKALSNTLHPRGLLRDVVYFG